MILPRGKGGPVTVPGIKVAVGEGCLPVWSHDGRRLLVGVQRGRPGGGLETTYAVHDLATKKTASLELPEGHWISGWSKDGKRLLSTCRADDAVRVCWISADGKGEPEYLTPEGESAWDPRLSPDGSRILFQAARAVPAGARPQARLIVMDLKTKKRVTVDEPGATHGHCWSGDGSAIAYTWQSTPLKGDENNERVTWLITCGADGRGSKKITSRRYTPATPGLHVTIFFQVIDWR